MCTARGGEWMEEARAVSIIITCLRRHSKRAPLHQPSLPCLHLLPTTSPHLCELITHSSLRPCSSPAAIRDRPLPPPSRSHLSELDLELSTYVTTTTLPYSGTSTSHRRHHQDYPHPALTLGVILLRRIRSRSVPEVLVGSSAVRIR